LQPDQH